MQYIKLKQKGFLSYTTVWLKANILMNIMNTSTNESIDRWIRQCCQSIPVPVTELNPFNCNDAAHRTYTVLLDLLSTSKGALDFHSKLLMLVNIILVHSWYNNYNKFMVRNVAFDLLSVPVWIYLSFECCNHFFQEILHGWNENNIICLRVLVVFLHLT